MRVGTLLVHLSSNFFWAKMIYPNAAGVELNLPLPVLALPARELGAALFDLFTPKAQGAESGRIGA